MANCSIRPLRGLIEQFAMYKNVNKILMNQCLNVRIKNAKEILQCLPTGRRILRRHGALGTTVHQVLPLPGGPLQISL